MTNLVETVLNDEYERILKLIEGASIFSKPVDKNNIRDLVVCAFYTGRNSRDEQIDQLFQEISELRGGRK